MLQKRRKPTQSAGSLQAEFLELLGVILTGLSAPIRGSVLGTRISSGQFKFAVVSANGLVQISPSNSVFRRQFQRLPERWNEYSQLEGLACIGGLR